MFSSIKKIFNYKQADGKTYHVSEKAVELNQGDTVGFIASSHGNIIALKKITRLLEKKHEIKYIFLAGDIMDEHAGYRECLEYALDHPLIEPVVGNHDLLIIKEDKIHNYEPEYLKLAESAYVHLNKKRKLIKRLLQLPSRINTPFFSVVHESVKYPYYAKITKLKKKTHTFGRTPDENLEAVFNSTLNHPYFTGSDHQGYVIDSVLLKKRYILPDESVTIKGSKIISIPSASLSKDPNYTHGYCSAVIEDDLSVTVTFHDIPDLLVEMAENSI